jgi:hypothetical protein
MNFHGFAIISRSARRGKLILRFSMPLWRNGALLVELALK